MSLPLLHNDHTQPTLHMVEAHCSMIHIFFKKTPATLLLLRLLPRTGRKLVFKIIYFGFDFGDLSLQVNTWVLHEFRKF